MDTRALQALVFFFKERILTKNLPVIVITICIVVYLLTRIMRGKHAANKLFRKHIIIGALTLLVLLRTYFPVR